MPKVSVVVRFRNEEPYLAATLEAVRAQQFPAPIEIVAIDNGSMDRSRMIAEQYADVVLSIEDYRPGVALNQAITQSSGDHVVVLSAHALPANDRWLSSLTSWLRDPQVLGVYGAQLYPCTSRFLDKRDLDIFSHLWPRTETIDSDFWNANSAFHRGSWEKEPFDETVIELEDHYWTKRLLPQDDRWIRFEPQALVYHYGHDARNDRTLLAPDPLDDSDRIDQALETLSEDGISWPEVMTAGLTLGSLDHVPDVGRTVPTVGRYLLEHPDFDVRWRMAAALGRIRTANAADYLIEGLSDSSFYPRDECAWSLARLGSKAAPATMEALDTLPLKALPFAALALGRSGTATGEERAMEVLATCLASGHIGVERDALYFLGETAEADGATGLVGTVVRRLGGDDDETTRAAAWCWGCLARNAQAADRLTEGEVVMLARQHPVETVRLEAVVALGRHAGTRRMPRLLDEVARALHCDGTGRVRYAAMQSLRLAAEAGNERAAELAGDHSDDPDFGVRFEQQLLRAHAAGLLSCASVKAFGPGKGWAR